MDLTQVMKQLEAMGSEQTRKTFRNHGANGDLYGVKIGDLKKLLKPLRGQQELALGLWDTNNSDAMYLASLIADGSKMTTKQLDHWAKTAWWSMLSEYAVPFVAAEHPQAMTLAGKWIQSKKESIATSGWATYGLTVAVRDDASLDFDGLRTLLAKVENEIGSAPDRVRASMNQFIIAIGCYVKPLLRDAKAVAKRIGQVDVGVGKTSCKIPGALDYIRKVEAAGRIGKKRSTAKC